MREIFIAIGAIIFYTIIMPILDSISGYVQSFFNKHIHDWQMQMAYDEAQVQSMTEEINTPKSQTNAVGFTLPNNCSEEDIDG